VSALDDVLRGATIARSGGAFEVPLEARGVRMFALV
jgi:hypothetical protein